MNLFHSILEMSMPLIHVKQTNLKHTSSILKGHSHYCVFRVRLRQTVAFPQGDRKLPISALTQPTAENADRCV